MFEIHIKQKNINTNLAIAHMLHVQFTCIPNCPHILQTLHDINCMCGTPIKISGWWFDFCLRAPNPGGSIGLRPGSTEPVHTL